MQVSRLLQLGFALLQQRRQLVSHLADLRDALPDQLGLQGLEGIGYLGYAYDNLPINYHSINIISFHENSLWMVMQHIKFIMNISIS